MRKLADAGDYMGLVRHLARASQKEIAPDFANAYIEEFKKHSWEVAQSCVESLVFGEITAYSLREHMWKHIITGLESAVLKEKEARRIAEQSTVYENGIPKKEIEKYDYQAAMRSIEKILKMTRLNPPVVINGEPVVFVKSETDACDIDSWIKNGRPKTWSALLDLYLRGYERSIQRGEPIEKYAETFEKYLDGLYSKWVDQQNEDKRKKILEMKEEENATA